MITNASYLFLAQGINYLIPLVTLPFLVTHLGVQAFGEIAFGQAVALYVQLVGDYGFNTSATRRVATIRHDAHEELRTYVSSITACKVMLLVGLLLVAVPLLYVTVQPSGASQVNLILLISAVGNALTPIWFYQGRNQMAVVAIASAASKIIGAVIILALVRTADDGMIAAWAFSAPPIIIAVLCCWDLKRRGFLVLRGIDIRGVWQVFREGAPFFLSSAGAGVLANSGVFILGLFHSSAVVGVYAASEKIIKAAVGCLSPVSQSLYPINAKAFDSSIEAGFKSVRSTSVYLLVPALVGTTVLFVAAPFLLNLLNWTDPRYLKVIRLLCPWIIMGVMNNILGVQILGAMGEGRPYARAFLTAAAVTIILFLLLTPWMVEIGIITSMLIGEGVLSLLILVAIKRLKRET